LNCTEEYLPHQLGYLPLRYPVSQMIYGPDFLMFDPQNSEELRHFYRALYTAMKEEIKDFTDNGIIGSLTSQYRLVLPYRTDKKMKEIIQEFFSSRNDTMEDVLSRMNENWLFPEELDLDPLAEDLRVMSYFIGMRRNYAFMDSFHMHSVVRAMQACSNKMMMMPSEDKKVSMFEFVSIVMDMSEENSALNIMSNEMTIMALTLRAYSMLMDMVRSDSLRHNKRKKISFKSPRTSVRATKKEILSLLRLEENARKSRVIKTLEDICASLGMNMENLMMNSNEEVEKVFYFSKYPKLAFLDYIDDFVSQALTDSSKIMCSFMDRGSDIENLTRLMGERINPMFIMTLDSTDKNVTFNRMFRTMISMGEELNSSMLTRMIRSGDLDMSTIYKDESRETTAFKMFLSKHFTPMDMHSMKVMVSTKRAGKTMSQTMFTNLNETVFLTKKDAKWYVEIYTKESLSTFDMRSELMNKVNMEIAAEQIDRSNLFYVKDGDKVFTKEFTLMPLSTDWVIYLKRMKTKYSIMMEFRNTFMLMKFNYFSDYYKMDMDSMNTESNTMRLMRMAMNKDATMDDLNELVCLLEMRSPAKISSTSFNEKGMSYSIDISEVMSMASMEFDFMDFEKEFGKEMAAGSFDFATMEAMSIEDDLTMNILDDKMFEEISAMMSMEADEDIEGMEGIPLCETVVIIKVIMRAIRSIINKNYCINQVFVKGMSTQNLTDEQKDKMWSIVYTEVSNIFSSESGGKCCRNLIDMIFAVFASIIKTKTVIKAPKEVRLFHDMKLKTKCIEKYMDVESFKTEFGL